MGRHVNNLNILEECSYALVKPEDLKNKDPERLSKLAKSFKVGAGVSAIGVAPLLAGIAMTIDGKTADAGNWLIVGMIGTAVCAVSYTFYSSLKKAIEERKKQNNQKDDRQLGVNLINDMMKRIRKHDFDCKDTDPALYTALEMYSSIEDLASVPVDGFNDMIVCLAKYRDLYQKNYSSNREERMLVRIDDLKAAYSEYIDSLSSLARREDCPLEAKEKFAYFALRKDIKSTSEIEVRNRRVSTQQALAV